MKKPKNYKLAFYRSIPAYFDLETDQLIGRNWLYDLAIRFNVWWDFKVIGIDELPILIED